MSILNSDYRRCIELSERVAWKISEIFPHDTSLNFKLPFMPSAMFQSKSLTFLDQEEKLKLNQIFGNGYRYLFYFVEAYIITMAMDHARAELYGDDTSLRALLRFAEEEVKHQQMFTRFGEMFDSHFGSACEVVDSPQAVAEVILSKTPMAVVLVTLHLELITQAHYVDSIRDNKDIEPLFASLFKHHWLEEAQHAKLDALELIKLRRDAEEPQVETAINDYFDICNAFAGLLGAQAKLDAGSLERAIGRTFTEAERGEITTAVAKSYQRAFLWYGFTNTLFVEFVAEYFPSALERVTQAAALYE
jgi:hypothetical protein